MGSTAVFVFIVGGVIGIIRATGAIDALIGSVIRRFSGNMFLLITGMITLFALGSSTIGMAEEYMPFIPVLVTMCLALRMDAMVALGIVYMGAGIGYGCAALNPFTVQIAQRISDLTPTSGQGAIIVTAAPDHVPKPLVDQLKVGGRMILPVGDRVQELVVLEKTAKGTIRRSVLPVRFVPMTGEARRR